MEEGAKKEGKVVGREGKVAKVDEVGGVARLKASKYYGTVMRVCV